MIRSFNGKSPKIDSSAYVSEAAYVLGDVEVGEGSGIWPGAVVRADFAGIRIGRHTMIEDNCVLHAGRSGMEIGDNVIVGHSVVVHARKIGDNNLVGNNATVLENCEIGSHCIIGAGSLVSAGMKVPDNSLVVGAPAVVKRQLSPAQHLRLERGSAAYRDLVKQYKDQGL